MKTIVCTGWKIIFFIYFLFMSKTVQMRHRKATRYRGVSSLKPSKTLDSGDPEEPGPTAEGPQHRSEA
jgi:hypothetical protein